MEFFKKSNTIRLRSHLNKFLLAEDDDETVRQSRNRSSHKVNWTVEFVETNSQVVRLKSSNGRYLTASYTPFLLGMTGNKVIQTTPITKFDSSIEWVPIKDGSMVKLKSWNDKFLRANGGTPPWKNSVTHDIPYRNSTKNWILWHVDMVDASDVDSSFAGYQSPLSSFSSHQSPLSSFSSRSEDPLDWPETQSLEATNSPRLISSRQKGMELFHNAKAVRLRSHHDKYLSAEEDEDSVCQDRNGSSKNAKWTVEFVQGSNVIRLVSCYGKYLTASNQPFLLGMTGRKVLQTHPRQLDSSVEWEPIREGFQIKLKTVYGNFLRANGGVPPWRNSVTHDIPHRTATQDWVLWDVDIVEIQVQASPSRSDPSPSEPISPTSSISSKSPSLSKLESNDSFTGLSSPVKDDGRTIYFHIADDNGNVDDENEGVSFSFKGNGVDELTQKLVEKTGLEDIIVCSRNLFNGNLYPLRLDLPPNNATMNVVVVKSSSKVARNLARPGLL